MSKSETVWRSLHDVGLASWFGGSVFGTIALDHGVDDATDNSSGGSAASLEGSDISQTQARSAESGVWQRWIPVEAASMAAHLIGGAGLVVWNRKRIQHQEGVATTTGIKAALTGVAVAATVLTWRDGATLQKARTGEDVPKEKVAAARKRMGVLRYVLPASTGAVVVMTSIHGEQQRPREMGRGVLHRTGHQLVDALPSVSMPEMKLAHRLAEVTLPDMQALKDHLPDVQDLKDLLPDAVASRIG